MKKIIEGRMYDTDAAEFVCAIDNGCHSGDSKFEISDLYRTENGNYFLFGRGGAFSRFAIILDNGGRTDCTSDTIIALTEAEARHLIERHGEAEDYIRCFGQPEDA